VLDDVLDDEVEDPPVVDDPPRVVELEDVEEAEGPSSPSKTNNTMGTATAAAITMPIRKRARGVRHQGVPPGPDGTPGGGGGGGAAVNAESSG